MEKEWSSSCNFINSQQVITNNYSSYLNNPNWDNSMDQSDPFESALSSIVSSPSASNSTAIIPGVGHNVMIKELIGRLGSICNSAQNNTPLNYSPPPPLSLNHNLSMTNNCSRYLPIPRPMNSPAASASASDNADSNSKENSSLSEQIPSQTVVTHSNPRKRKSISTPKAKESPSSNHPKVKAVAENPEDSNSKRSKQEENKSDSSKAKESTKDYIHVRARRGQATDSHSLAERVRREKISERMKFLQDLVPGCNKVTGKAVMLDEIINYVQSLQRQVEFLSMKLATLNPRIDLNMEALLSKDMFQSRGSVQRHSLYAVDCSALTGYQPQQQRSNLTSNAENSVLHKNPNFQFTPINGYGEAACTSQVPSLWEDDLQSLVQMGFNQNQPLSLLNGSMATSQMKD